MPNEGDSLADSQAWITWLETVPPDERERVAELVVSVGDAGWNGLHKHLRSLVAEVLRGTLSPVVVQTLTGLIDRQMAALFMEHKEQNVLDAYPQSAAGTILQLERVVASVKPLQPRYIERHDPIGDDILDSVMPEVPEMPKVTLS